MLRPRFRTPAVLLAALLLGACGRGAPPATISPVLRVDTVLVMRPGDVIKIDVWGHEELSGEFPVDENYNLQFPIIGEINVRETSVASLRDRLRTELNALFTQPYVTIVPLFRVAVLGEVVRPGLYNADPTLTVYDVLALAGGPLRTANERGMRLIRAGEQIPVAVDPASLARATLRELGIRSGDQVIVPRRSITREDWGILIALANTVLLAYSILR
jgi:polysaccharide export outer membrane protein